MSPEKRKYELRKRAESMQETRERITSAAMELHTTVGPSRTSISAVAERAGVQRHTVYRHFATDAELFAACSAHFYEAVPFPDAALGLDALYAYYERTGDAWETIMRDAHLVHAVVEGMAPFTAHLEETARVLAGDGGPLVQAAARHAVDFQTWRSLRGIDRADAVALMRAMLREAARAAPPRPAR
jgi:AcrR family transcriptional regulator